MRERPLGDEPAAVDDADHVAEFLHFAHDVGGIDHGLAARLAVTDEFHNRPRRHHIESKRRFVENHNGRIMNQRAGDRRFLLHAGGKLVAAPVEEFVHVELVRQPLRARAHFGRREIVERAEIRDHLPRRETAVKRGRGGEEADVRPYLLRCRRHIVPGDHRRSGRGLEQRGEHPERGGLARPVGPEQAVDLARRD